MFNTKAIVKNTAPQKHGVAKGFLALIGHPLLHCFPCLQATNSDIKLYQAKIVPARRMKN